MQKTVAPPPNNPQANRYQEMNKKYTGMLKEMEDNERTMVQLGEASMAAPFTSRTGAIDAGIVIDHFSFQIEYLAKILFIWLKNYVLQSLSFYYYP